MPSCSWLCWPEARPTVAPPALSVLDPCKGSAVGLCTTVFTETFTARCCINGSSFLAFILYLSMMALASLGIKGFIQESCINASKKAILQHTALCFPTVSQHPNSSRFFWSFLVIGPFLMTYSWPLWHESAKSAEACEPCER